MEKGKAHYDLASVKAVVAMQGLDAFTRTALCGIHASATVIQFKEK